jgi:hypothetical protein
LLACVCVLRLLGPSERADEVPTHVWRARATGSPQDTWSRTRGSYSG